MGPMYISSFPKSSVCLSFTIVPITFFNFCICDILDSTGEVFYTGFFDTFNEVVG